MEERDRDDGSSILNDNVSTHAVSTTSASTEVLSAQHNIDLLFDREEDTTSWEPVRPPEVLGELLDSPYMLPLLLPSDPVMLSAMPKLPAYWQNENVVNGLSDSRCPSRTSKRSAGSIPWQIMTKYLRDTSLSILRWVDGAGSYARWVHRVNMEGGPEDEDCDGETLPPNPTELGDDQGSDTSPSSGVRRVTPLTRRPSLRTKGRASTPVDRNS
jgi:hypothetical protein